MYDAVMPQYVYGMGYQQQLLLLLLPGAVFSGQLGQPGQPTLSGIYLLFPSTFSCRTYLLFSFIFSS